MAGVRSLFLLHLIKKNIYKDNLTINNAVTKILNETKNPVSLYIFDTFLHILHLYLLLIKVDLHSSREFFMEMK